jgi:hypothetical protein
MATRSRLCQRCKQPIEAERLEALPETRLCVQCSRQRGGDIRLRIRTRNTGKGGIKQTGTDIDSVELERRPLPDDSGETT